jgi:hypothetical protein
MSATRVGTRPCATKASATFRRRSCCVSPRWRGEPLALVSSDRTGNSQSAASSVARRSAAWCPRFSLRSGSPGTNTTHAASGRASDSRTTAARRSAPRTARRAVPRCGGAPRCSPGRPALRDEGKGDTAGAGPDRARHHDARDARVSCLCQLGEYSVRSGRPCRRRMRLSASSNWVASPMSYHRPSKRYA